MSTPIMPEQEDDMNEIAKKADSMGLPEFANLARKVAEFSIVPEQESLREEVSKRVAVFAVSHDMQGKAIINPSFDDTITSIMHLIEQDRERAVREAVTKIMMTDTEGMFSGKDLFIKRAPLEQTFIDLVGYETYKAIMEAATSAQERSEQ